MRLSALPVDPANPTAILPALEAAIAGHAAWLPIPASPLSADRARAEVLQRTQRVGADIDPAIALVMATSGSTGTPKGAMLTPANLVASADATHAVLGGPGHWVLALPAHHIAGILVLVRALIAGVEPWALDLRQGFDLGDFARQSAAAQATGERCYTALTPMQLAKAMDELRGIEALQGYHAVLVGGGALDPELGQAAARLGIKVRATYGSSETTGGCVYDGRPLPGVSVQIRDGRICLGGATIAQGYRNAPDHEAFSQPGWFRSSDSGVIDGGLLQVTGRIDTIISTGGLKLQPEVLEAQLLSQPGVAEVCVSAIADPRLGQAVVAAYVGSATPSEVLAGLADAAVPRWQHPKALRRVAQLPRTSLGKVDRQAVAALFQQ